MMDDDSTSTYLHQPFDFPRDMDRDRDTQGDSGDNFDK